MIDPLQTASHAKAIGNLRKGEAPTPRKNAPITLEEAKKIERKWAGRVFVAGGVTKNGQPIYIVSPQ